MEDSLKIINFVQFVNEYVLRMYLRDLENPLEFYSDSEFHKRYR